MTLPLRYVNSKKNSGICIARFSNSVLTLVKKIPLTLIVDMHSFSVFFVRSSSKRLAHLSKNYQKRISKKLNAIQRRALTSIPIKHLRWICLQK